MASGAPPATSSSKMNEPPSAEKPSDEAPGAQRKRLLIVTLLALASGLPLGLVSFTIPVWLRTRGLSLESIGLLSLASLPWGLKILWAPLIDRYTPFGGGRRRGWIRAMLAALALACFGLALLDEQNWLAPVSLLILATAFFSATQDIALDAYAVELMHLEDYGRGNGLRVAAYRIAMLLSGGATVAAAQFLDFSVLFAILGGAFLALTLIPTLAPEVTGETFSRPSLYESIIGPFRVFLKTPDAVFVLLFILLFKFGDNLAISMLQPFLVDQKYSLAEIGLAQKTVGLIATLCGAMVGGYLTSAIGLGRGLLLSGVLQAASHVGYYAMALAGFNRPIMYGGVALESFCGGIGTAAFLAYIMSLCDKRYTATQYALLTSLFGLARTFSGVPSGYLAEALGYADFFLATILAALPGIYLAWKVGRRFNRASAKA